VLAKQGLLLPVEFVWLRSYAGREGGEVAVLAGPPESLQGKTALVVDGVLDRGHTLLRACALAMERGARAVMSVVAVDKGRPDALLRADHALFSGVAEFVVGYGMDDGGQGRGLPYIARVE